MQTREPSAPTSKLHLLKSWKLFLLIGFAGVLLWALLGAYDQVFRITVYSKMNPTYSKMNAYSAQLASSFGRIKWPP